MGRLFSIPESLPWRREKPPKASRDVLARPPGLMERTKPSHPVLSAVLWILGIAAAAGGSAYGIREYLLRSPAYRIRTIIINGNAIEATDRVLSTQSQCQVMDIRRVTSIFAIDPAEARRKLLRVPTIEEVRISRRLPDTLVVDYHERDPIVRLGQTSLMVDRSGVVFEVDSRPRMLPNITGYYDASHPLAPGDHVDGLALAAIELLAFCGDGLARFPVGSIDVSREDHLLCRMQDNRQILLAWQGMGTRTAESRQSLETRLAKLLAVLDSPSAQRYRTFDASISDQDIHGLP